MNHHPIINGDTRDYSSRDFLDAKTILEFLSVFDLYVKKNGKIDRIEIQSEIDIFGDRKNEFHQNIGQQYPGWFWDDNDYILSIPIPYHKHGYPRINPKSGKWITISKTRIACRGMGILDLNSYIFSRSRLSSALIAKETMDMRGIKY